MKRVVALLNAVTFIITITAIYAQQGPEAETHPSGSDSFEGRVVDRSGVPIEGATVEAVIIPLKYLKYDHIQGELTSPESFTLTMATDSSGTYKFSVLPNAKVEVSVKADGFNKVKLESKGLIGGDQITDIDFTLQPELSINGQILNSNGEPLRGVRVTAEPELEKGLPQPEIQQANVTSFSDEDGRYTIGSLGEGSYTVVAKFPRHIPGEIGRVSAGSSNIDFTMYEGGGLRGMVRDEMSKAPVPGAGMSIKAEYAPFRTTRVTTDENGLYKILSLDTGAYTLEVIAEGYMDNTLTGIEVREGEIAENIDIYLQPRPRISGTVTLEGGKPAVDAKLYLTQGYGGSSSGKAEAAVDERGRYEIIKGTPGQRCVVAAEFPGYIPGVSESFQLLPDKDQNDIDLVLKKGLSLSGIVIDESHKAVAHAKVKAQGAKKRSRGLASRALDWRKRRITAYTNKMGRFTLASLEPGTYTVTASVADYGSGKVENIQLSEDTEPEPVTIVLSFGLTISGQVTDTARNPIERADVSTNVREQGRFHQRSARTDKDGRYELVSLPPGSYDVAARMEEYASKKIRDVESPAENVDFTLIPAGRISGRVVDSETGESITKFHLMPYEGSANLFIRHRDDSSSEDGRFETKPLDPGEYKLLVNSEGYAPKEKDGIKVESGETTHVEIKLDAGATIIGEVFTEKRRLPVAGARIAVQEDTGSRYYRDSDILKEPHLSDEEGSFTISNLPTGSFKLKVTHPDFAEETETVKIGKEGKEVKIKIALKKGRSISGITLDQKTSQPIPGAKVVMIDDSDYFENVTSTSVPDGNKSAVSDSSGRWELIHISPGTHYLRAYHDQYSTPEYKSVTVKPDGEPSDIKFFFSSGARVSGTVRDASGNFLLDVKVSTSDTGLFKTAITDQSGRYALENLNPGPHTFTARPERHAEAFPSKSKPVLIAPHDDIVLDFTLGGNSSISGRILREGNPVEEVYVSLSGGEEGELVHARGRSGTDGNYRIGGLAPGSYDMRLSKGINDKGFSYIVSHPVVISVDLEGYDIALPTGRIIGSVVDKDGKPIKKVLISLIKNDGKESLSLMEEMVKNHLFSTKSDSRGRFEFPTLEAGTYLVTATKKGLGQAMEAITVASNESQAETTLTLLPACLLKIKILGAQTGKPIKKAALQLKDRSGVRIKMKTVSAKDGILVLNDLAAGTYRVEAGAEGYAPGVLDSVTVSPDAERPVELTLDRGATVKVTVINEKRKPLGGALVELIESSGKRYQPSWPLAKRFRFEPVTGSNGEVTVDCLPQGAFTIKIRKKGYTPANAEIDVEKGKESAATLTLKKK